MLDAIHRDPPPAKPATPEFAANMTLRDHFAAVALQGAIAGVMANGAAMAAGDDAILSEVAYKFADAMLAERSK